VLLRGLIDAGDYKQFIFPLLFYKRVSDVWDEEYQVALANSGGDLSYAQFAENHRFPILKLNDKFSTYLKTDRVGHKLGLYINDLYFKDLPAAPVVGRESAAMFHLVRTDANRDSWSVLFARKAFSLKRSASCTEDQNNIIRLTVGYEDGTQVGPNVDACLDYFPNGWSSSLLLAGAAVLIALTLFLAFKTSMLRDADFPVSGKKTTGAWRASRWPCGSSRWSAACCSLTR
jgi:hypothetical protein